VPPSLPVWVVPNEVVGESFSSRRTALTSKPRWRARGALSPSFGDDALLPGASGSQSIPIESGRYEPVTNPGTRRRGNRLEFGSHHTCTGAIRSVLGRPSPPSRGERRTLVTLDET
jgi:hypothetical protein